MSSEIERLATLIAENTAKVNSYLVEKKLPQPSFAVDGPLKSMIPTEASEIEAARVTVIEATLKLRNLMLGPSEYLMTFQHNELISLQAITRFKLASTFPIKGEVSCDEISKKSGLEEPDVRRFLRHAITKGIFEETQKGTVRHNAVSRLLAEDEVMRDWASVCSDELWQSASQTVAAMVKYPNSQEPHETGFALANNTDRSIYMELSQHPERARRFGSSLKAFTEGTGFDLQHVSNGFDWASLSANATVVDVGGSTGFVSTHLANEFPQLKFIVQDLPSVLEGVDTPPSLADRVTLAAHDFLTEQPVKNADVYFFRWIFHNWSDKYSIQILRNLIPALKPGARILINDNVLPPPGLLPGYQETRLRSMDLCMLEIQNSREREMEDWKALVAKADPRFKFMGGKMPPGSILWMIEVQWAPN